MKNPFKKQSIIKSSPIAEKLSKNVLHKVVGGGANATAAIDTTPTASINATHSNIKTVG